MQQSRLELLKEKLKQGYVNYLPNQILLDSRLHASSIKVYAILSMVSFGDRCECYHSQRTLAEMAGLSVKTVSRCLKELANCKYINKQFRLGDTCIYTLVHKFAQTITNKIKNKVNEVKEKVSNKNKDKKNFKKQEKQSNFNNYPQRNYDDEYFNTLERQLLGWDQIQENQYGEVYQQALLL